MKEIDMLAFRVALKSVGNMQRDAFQARRSVNGNYDAWHSKRYTHVQNISQLRLGWVMDGPGRSIFAKSLSKTLAYAAEVGWPFDDDHKTA